MDRLSRRDLAHAVDAGPLPGMSHEPLLDAVSEEVPQWSRD